MCPPKLVSFLGNSPGSPCTSQYLLVYVWGRVQLVRRSLGRSRPFAGDASTSRQMRLLSNFLVVTAVFFWVIKGTLCESVRSTATGALLLNVKVFQLVPTLEEARCCAVLLRKPRILSEAFFIVIFLSLLWCTSMVVSCVFQLVITCLRIQL